MSELVGISTPGGAVVSTVGIISAHPKAKCIHFAHVLLNNRLLVQKLMNKQKWDLDGFVNAVINKWVASGTATWEDLLEAMITAGMDGDGIMEIRDVIPLTGKVTR